MTVKFEFEMEDVDVENLIWAIRDSAFRRDEYIMEYEAREDLTREQKDSYIENLKDSKEYILGLIDKMTNTRVGE
jgi:hypothetical protein